MTNLEIVLITIIWISYGLYAAYRTNDAPEHEILIVCYIALAPVVFCVKAIYGAFKEYNM